MEVTGCWESPAGTVTVVTWSDKTITVVSDLDFASGDWVAACAELQRLSAAPLGLPEREGEQRRVGNRSKAPSRSLSPVGTRP